MPPSIPVDARPSRCECGGHVTPKQTVQLKDGRLRQYFWCRTCDRRYRWDHRMEWGFPLTYSDAFEDALAYLEQMEGTNG